MVPFEKFKLFRKVLEEVLHFAEPLAGFQLAEMKFCQLSLCFLVLAGAEVASEDQPFRFFSEDLQRVEGEPSDGSEGEESEGGVPQREPQSDEEENSDGSNQPRRSGEILQAHLFDVAAVELRR